MENIEKLHKQYENYMEGFFVISTQSIFLPFYKVNLRMKYTASENLNILEEYICRLLERDIRRKEDILEVLSIDEVIFSNVVTTLLGLGYIEAEAEAAEAEEEVDDETEAYFITEIGRMQFQEKIKYEPREANVSWYYDGLRDQYKIEYFSWKETHRFYGIDELKSRDKSIILPPKVVPSYEEQRDYEKMKEHFLSKVMLQNRLTESTLSLADEKITDIESFTLLPEKEVLYHEFYLFLYTNGQGDYRLLAHDPCGLEFIDDRVTETLEQLLASEDIDPSITEAMDAYPSMNKILSMLKKTLVEEGENISEDEAEIAMTKIEQIAQKNVKSEYIMNHKIRELFLQYLEEAQESLYIISPWMNHHIINREFKDQIIKLLKRGVEIRILYGLTDKQEFDKSKRNRTKDIAEELIRLAEPYGDQFKMSFKETHEKLLICDKKYYINGSFNFLSYSGDNSEYFKNEGCTYTEDEDLIHQTIKLRFQF